MCLNFTAILRKRSIIACVLHYYKFARLRINESFESHAIGGSESNPNGFKFFARSLSDGIGSKKIGRAASKNILIKFNGFGIFNSKLASDVDAVIDRHILRVALYGQIPVGVCDNIAVFKAAFALAPDVNFRTLQDVNGAADFVVSADQVDSATIRRKVCLRRRLDSAPRFNTARRRDSKFVGGVNSAGEL